MQKKNKSIKKAHKETTLIKIAGAIGEIAGKIVNQKDHLVEVASNAIDSVKTAVHDIRAKKQASVKKDSKKIVKSAVKKIVKPAVKKVKKSVVLKKASIAKKTVSKSIKKVAKKSIKKATKKK